MCQAFAYLANPTACGTINAMLWVLWVGLWSVFGFCQGGLDAIATDAESVIQAPSKRVVWHMPRHNNRVALTFDDGPDERITPQILQVLNQYNVKATFFVVGHMVAKAPHIAKAIHQNGHHIANHTWAHYRLDEMTQTQVTNQMHQTMQTLQALNQPMTPYFRPPGGRFNNYVLHSAKQLGLTVVMWDVNASDYKNKNGQHPPPDLIAKRVIRQVKPGSIVLMHNGPSTVKALPTIIGALQKKGFELGLLLW